MEGPRPQLPKEDPNRPFGQSVPDDILDGLFGLLGINDPLSAEASKATQLGGVAGAAVLPFTNLPKTGVQFFSKLKRALETLPDSAHPNKVKQVLSQAPRSERALYNLDPILSQGATKLEVADHLDRTPPRFEGGWGPAVEVHPPPLDGMDYGEFSSRAFLDARRVREQRTPYRVNIFDSTDVKRYEPLLRDLADDGGHWPDSPFAIGHTRSLHLLDEKAPGNPRGRVIEEVQGDAHQQGAKHGYATPEELTTYDSRTLDVVRDLAAAQTALNQGLKHISHWDFSIEDARLAAAHVFNSTNDPRAAYQAAMRLVPPAEQAKASPFVARYVDAFAARMRQVKDRPALHLPYKDDWEDLLLKYHVADAVNQDEGWIGLATGDMVGRSMLNMSPIREQNMRKALTLTAGDPVQLAQQQRITKIFDGMRGNYDEKLLKKLQRIIQPDTPPEMRQMFTTDDAFMANEGQGYPGSWSSARILQLTPQIRERIRKNGLPFLTALPAAVALEYLREQGMAQPAPSHKEK